MESGKIYVLRAHDYDCNEILGVFSDKKLADIAHYEALTDKPRGKYVSYCLDTYNDNEYLWSDNEV